MAEKAKIKSSAMTTTNLLRQVAKDLNLYPEDVTKIYKAIVDKFTSELMNVNEENPEIVMKPIPGFYVVSKYRPPCMHVIPSKANNGKVGEKSLVPAKAQLTCEIKPQLKKNFNEAYFKDKEMMDEFLERMESKGEKGE